MRVIGVVDLLGGLAVHAEGGRREHYRAVEAVGGSAILPGDALALARAYLGRLGVEELYVADLDAILGGSSQDGLVSAIAGLGVPVWVDAGATSVDAARHGLDLGAARVIVGLETLRSFDVLADICSELGGDRVVFSLDLRNGEPVVASGSSSVSAGESPCTIAERAANAGVGALIVIDLARVGAGAGLDRALLERIRQAAPGPILLAGGGIRGAGDLERLAAAGCDGALIATALQDGRLDATQIAAARGTQPIVRR
jgi:phosphoribosylformimino-5-aminoimidazole carboxamide ribotide isomerase